jgi:ABC-type oligopeptide transport system ATPase subunit
LEKISEEQKSIYTLDYFEETDEIYELEQHNNCKVKTWYSKEEIEIYVMKQGCVWCKYIPLSTDLVKVCKIDWSNKIKESMSKGNKFTVNNIDTIFNSFGEINLDSEQKRYRINLIGITGSGKTTCSEKITKVIETMGGTVLVVSADKWSKQNFKGKDLHVKIQNEIKQFDIKPNKLKVIIMDLCNENGIDKHTFGFNFNNYIDINFYPNLDAKNVDLVKFDEYECWCLNNVLSRPQHNLNSNYWLNPVSAGVEICIKVHNAKANGISKLLGITKTNNFNQKLNKIDIFSQIKSKSNKYSEYLKTIDLDLEINNLVIKNII